ESDRLAAEAADLPGAAPSPDSQADAGGQLAGGNRLPRALEQGSRVGFRPAVHVCDHDLREPERLSERARGSFWTSMRRCRTPVALSESSPVSKSSVFTLSAAIVSSREGSERRLSSRSRDCVSAVRACVSAPRTPGALVG